MIKEKTRLMFGWTFQEYSYEECISYPLEEETWIWEDKDGNRNAGCLKNGKIHFLNSDRIEDTSLHKPVRIYIDNVVRLDNIPIGEVCISEDGKLVKKTQSGYAIKDKEEDPWDIINIDAIDRTYRGLSYPKVKERPNPQPPNPYLTGHLPAGVYGRVSGLPIDRDGKLPLLNGNKVCIFDDETRIDTDDDRKPIIVGKYVDSIHKC